MREPWSHDGSPFDDPGYKIIEEVHPGPKGKPVRSFRRVPSRQNSAAPARLSQDGSSMDLHTVARAVRGRSGSPPQAAAAGTSNVQAAHGRSRSVGPDGERDYRHQHVPHLRAPWHGCRRVSQALNTQRPVGSSSHQNGDTRASAQRGDANRHATSLVRFLPQTSGRPRAARSQSTQRHTAEDAHSPHARRLRVSVSANDQDSTAAAERARVAVQKEAASPPAAGARKRSPLPSMQLSSRRGTTGDLPELSASLTPPLREGQSITVEDSATKPPGGNKVNSVLSRVAENGPRANAGTAAPVIEGVTELRSMQQALRGILTRLQAASASKAATAGPTNQSQ